MQEKKMEVTKMEEDILLPSNSWKKIRPFIKLSGERESVSKSDMGDDFQFLEDLGIFSKTATGELTDVGEVLFESAFIRCDGKEVEILRELLLLYPPTLAIQQYLWGARDINIDQALVVLKATGFWFYDSKEPLTHFLDLLSYTGIISYNRKLRRIKILISPDAAYVPKSIFIDPARPFSNIMWVKRVIGECEDFIYWLDKNFQKEALEWLWSVLDANKITEVKILSLDMGEANLGHEARNYYKRFKAEMLNKGISVTWATIDSKLIRDSHDRWIIGGNNYLRNIPNVNAINSGQRSEINFSDNYNEMLPVFGEYWAKAKEV